MKQPQTNNLPKEALTVREEWPVVRGDENLGQNGLVF